MRVAERNLTCVAYFVARAEAGRWQARKQVCAVRLQTLVVVAAAE